MKKSIPATVRDNALTLAALILSFIAVGFVAVAFISLLARLQPVTIASSLHSDVVRQALVLSLETSFASVAIIMICGTPLAAILAIPFRGRALLETLVTLPVVLPPVVGGLALLLAFGRAGLLGQALHVFGVQLPFTTAAVVMAQTFVAAPLYVAVAKGVFSRVSSEQLDAAATLGASRAYTFLRVVMPPLWPVLLGGLALSWARALGEFGATITFAGNLPGVTQTMPIAVYLASALDLHAAIAIAIILAILSYGALLAVRALSGSGSVAL